jgi:hypothetical protein
MIGKPMRSASATARSTSSIGSTRPGTTGTPAACIVRRAMILSPIVSIASAGGPIHTSPASTTARAKYARSLRKP